MANEPIKMMQGDSWPLEFGLNFNGKALTPETVEKLEMTLDGLSKTWPEGGLGFNAEKGLFAFWLTQEESFKLLGQVKAQARAKLKENGLVIGFDLGSIQIVQSQSKEVL